jgi:hypothetical protein
MRQCLRPNGRLVLLVPAHPQLYCGLDVEVGHYRRYSKHGLVQLLQRSGFCVETVNAFNAWGLIGWWLNGRLLGRTRLPGDQLSLFGRFAWLLLWVERLVGPPIGLSLIAVATINRGLTDDHISE